MAIKKLCNYPSCQCFAIEGHNYCNEHYVEHKPFENAVRSNEGLYNTQAWRTLRKNHLIHNPRCVMCGSTENLTVDHIIDPRGNPGLFYEENNLQTLCKDCHRLKTAQEITERNRSKKNVK